MYCRPLYLINCILFQISELYGGMEVCGLSIIVSKDGREYILRACDSTFSLMGDSQEEDRRHIADLVVSRMQNVCRPPIAKTASRTSLQSSRGASPTEETPGGMRSAPPSTAPPPIPERSTPGVGSIGRLGSLGSVSEPPLSATEPLDKSPNTAAGGVNIARRDSQASQSSTVSGGTTSSRTTNPKPTTQSSVIEDAEDTMKNLRKTFAGIFGDMQDLAKKKSNNKPQENTPQHRGRTISDTFAITSKDEPKLASSISHVDKLSKKSDDINSKYESKGSTSITSSSVFTSSTSAISTTTISSVPITTTTTFSTSQFSNERVNPFDKPQKNDNGSSSGQSSSFSYTPETTPKKTVSDTNKTYSSITKPPPLKSTDRVRTDSESSSDGGKSLDDLIKDRFQKNQGIRDENTGRYSIPDDDIKKPLASTFTDTSNITTKSDQTSYTKSEFPSTNKKQPLQRSSGSLSDAEIIFGNPITKKSTTRPGTRYSIDNSSYDTGNYSSSSSSITTATTASSFGGYTDTKKSWTNDEFDLK